jgi:hypothetical protein
MRASAAGHRALILSLVFERGCHPEFISGSLSEEQISKTKAIPETSLPATRQVGN